MGKKKKFKRKIDWRSKLIDLFIVVLGITIAFKLNTWNETRRSKEKAKNYIESFIGENSKNEENLVSALEFSTANLTRIDTLKFLLLSKQYSDSRIQTLTTNMMALANYNPSVTTMENIKASGDFEILQDVELRKGIINTYNAYETTAKLEVMLMDYVNEYVTPYFIKGVRFSDGSEIKNDFITDPFFENIVFGYSTLLQQQIIAYGDNLELIRELGKALEPKEN